MATPPTLFKDQFQTAPTYVVRAPGRVNLLGDYKLQPVGSTEYIPANPRTDAPDKVGGNLKVASFNVLNYFTTLNERGADTHAGSGSHQSTGSPQTPPKAVIPIF